MKLDPVDQKALKGPHKNAKDKDINNDGKVNSSDEYLHNRRQAVSKALGKLKEEAELNELSQDKLYDYHAKASADLRAKRAKLDQGSLTMNDLKKGQNRVKGLNTAANKMKEEVEELDEIQVNWSHNTQKYHTIKHPDGSHYGVFDHGTYGTKGHEIRKIKDSDENVVKAKDSRKQGDRYKSGMGSPSEAAKSWTKKYGGTILNHKLKEEAELDEVKKAKPGNNAMVMAKNIGKVLAAVKKEETDDASIIAKHTKPLRMKLAQFRHEE